MISEKFRFVVFSGSWAAYGKKESSIRSTILNCMHPKHVRFFLNGVLLWTICSQFPRVYCIHWLIYNKTWMFLAFKHYRCVHGHQSGWLNAIFEIYKSCDLGHVIQPLCALVPSPEKQGYQKCLFDRMRTKHSEDTVVYLEGKRTIIHC